MMLRSGQIAELLQRNDFCGNPVVELIKRNNHVYRLQFGATTAYLKLYTKHWYGDDVPGTGYCVDHEVAAWRALRKHGLDAPEVLLADLTVDNALNRPFLMTRGLTGLPYTTAGRDADSTAFKAQLVAIGSYLGVMHRIAFAHPGYVTSHEPSAPPARDQWQHAIWTFGQFQRDTDQTWRSDRDTVSASVMDAVEDFYEDHAPELAATYSNPHFTHGDCHAHQFFLRQAEEGWRVSGVVDMEVASAGDSGADLLKFGIEMAALFPADTLWWQHLFEGYGEEPSFDLARVRLLAAHHINYSWIWPGATRERILRHILTAGSWHDLYDLRRLDV